MSEPNGKREILKASVTVGGIVIILNLVFGFIQSRGETSDGVSAEIVKIMHEQTQLMTRTTTALETLVSSIDEQKKLIRTGNAVDAEQLEKLDDLAVNLQKAIKRQVTLDDLNDLKRKP